MRRPEQSPSIVPPGEDHDVYLVLDDFGGRIGQSWRETDVGTTDLETLIEDLLADQYSNPVRIAYAVTVGQRVTSRLRGHIG
jgi:hypothetical protein